MSHNRTFGQLYDAGLKAMADSVHGMYKDRTRQMALSLGPDSELGEFLLNLYPLPE